MSMSDQQKFVRTMRMRRVALPVLLGLGVSGWMVWRHFDREHLTSIDWSGWVLWWVFAGFMLLVLRHLSYALRMKLLTGFSWRKCIELIFIWEFSSALAPTSKGGPFVMLFVLTREGLSAGKTAAAMLYTIILDAGFLVFTLPPLLALFGHTMLMPDGAPDGIHWTKGAFYFTYAFMMLYWAVFAFFLFVKPRWAAGFFTFLGRLPLIRRFQTKLNTMGAEFQLAAEEIRARNWQYHLGVMAGTLGAWTFKFLMINCLLIGFVPETTINGYNQLFVYARMIGMYIIMAFSPTPGAAGLAEMAMPHFMSDLAPVASAVALTLVWRAMAYYGYLIAGAIVVPAWVAGKAKV